MNILKTARFVSITLSVSLLAYSFSFAQVGNEYHGAAGQDLSKDYNVITTAVPFLIIAPDSRSSAMGDVGAATKTDVWSQTWNASKYPLATDDMSIGISYTPWMQSLQIKDMNLLYAAGYKKLSSKEAVGASVRYFSVGEIPAYDDNGQAANYSIHPKEYAVDASYSRYLSDFFTLGMTGRFIYSNFLGEVSPEYKPGKAVAADISGTFFKKINKDDMFTAGVNISNIGSKISYSANKKDFIPANLRIGAGYEYTIDEYNTLGVYSDISKLLVPTPPKGISYIDSAGFPQTEIVGTDASNMSPITGIFSSFSDAPGGAKEELKEFMFSIGAEYWYNKQFAARAGYFHEAETKGNRKYVTAGIGIRFNVFGLDVSYLVPVKAANSPLANTFRFSLTFDFAGLQQEAKENSQN